MQDSQQPRHLDEPAHVVGVDLVFDGPLGQIVPLVPRTSINGETQLNVLVFTLLQVCHHLLKCTDTPWSVGGGSRLTQNKPEMKDSSAKVLRNSSVNRLLISLDTLQESRGGSERLHCAVDSTDSTYLDNVSKILPLDMVVCFDEDLPEDGLSDGVVFGVEFVKAMESVTVLRERRDPNIWGYCLI